MTTSKLIFGLLGGGCILGAFICIIVALYLSWSQEKALLEHFKNSDIMKPMFPSDLRGRLAFVLGIAACVTFPRFFMKYGKLSEDDLKNCPVSLKRKLFILECATIGSISMAILTAGVGKLGGWM